MVQFFTFNTGPNLASLVCSDHSWGTSCPSCPYKSVSNVSSRSLVFRLCCWSITSTDTQQHGPIMASLLWLDQRLPRLLVCSLFSEDILLVCFADSWVADCRLTYIADGVGTVSCTVTQYNARVCFMEQWCVRLLVLCWQHSVLDAPGQPNLTVQLQSPGANPSSTLHI